MTIHSKSYIYIYQLGAIIHSDSQNYKRNLIEVKIEARSFSTAEIQQFRTENRQSDDQYMCVCGLRVKNL